MIQKEHASFFFLFLLLLSFCSFLLFISFFLVLGLSFGSVVNDANFDAGQQVLPHLGGALRLRGRGRAVLPWAGARGPQRGSDLLGR